MIILSHDQGTEEWRAARLGRPSASQFHRLITSTGKPSKSAGKYIQELVTERVTGERMEVYINEHMERGSALEPLARSWYEFLTGNTVEQVGFILHDSEEFGCSPDGLIEGAGLEIKCPADSTHEKYLENPDIALNKYKQQIQGCMWITGREHWDFMSYSETMEHLLVRVERDDEFIEKLAEEVFVVVNLIITESEMIA